MMRWILGTVQYAFGIGLIVCGPVSTMIIFPEKFGESYVYGATDGMLATLGILWLFGVYVSISKHHDEAG